MVTITPLKSPRSPSTQYQWRARWGWDGYLARNGRLAELRAYMLRLAKTQFKSTTGRNQYKRWNIRSIAASNFSISYQREYKFRHNNVAWMKITEWLGLSKWDQRADQKGEGTGSNPPSASPVLAERQQKGKFSAWDGEAGEPTQGSVTVGLSPET